MPADFASSDVQLKSVPGVADFYLTMKQLALLMQVAETFAEPDASQRPIMLHIHLRKGETGGAGLLLPKAA